MCKATCVCLCTLESTLNVEEKNFPSGDALTVSILYCEAPTQLLGYLNEIQHFQLYRPRFSNGGIQRGP